MREKPGSAVFIPVSSAMASGQPPRVPLLALGFRPFYLLAALWMVFAMPMWLAVWGHGYPLGNHLQHADWHGHEMLFGFTGAVITGFLFTAVKNWTGVPTPHGAALGALAICWLLARLFLASPLSWVGAVLDTLFYVGAAYGIAGPLLARQNQRNYIFPAVLLGLGIASALHHLAAAGLLGISASSFLRIALLLITVVITVIGGRVIPNFTRNAVGEAGVTISAARDKLTLMITVLAGLSLIVLPSFWISPVLALTAAGIQLYRWWGWAPRASLAHPMLWILHLSYLWLPISFFMHGMPADWLPMGTQLATHALTVGCIGGLCLGMMSRTARGHTGRAIVAGTAERWAFVLVAVAPVCRVLVPAMFPELYALMGTLAGIALVAAYAIYLLQFAPWLLSVRADGRPD